MEGERGRKKPPRRETLPFSPEEESLELSQNVLIGSAGFLIWF